MGPYLALTYYLIIFLLFVYFVAFRMDRISPSTSPQDPSSINDLVTEIDDFPFYHHPAWPQQWSHPDFTSDCESHWREAPWFKQTKERYTTRFLWPFLESKFPWGYIIYRTVYTPESDKQWPLALKKLDCALDYRIDSDFRSTKRNLEDMNEPEPESTPERLIKESRKHVVFSNKEFWDGASTEQIRAHFKQYLRASKGRGHGRFEGCIVIDEHSLKSIIAASTPCPRLGEGFVGMVDGRYPEETGKEQGYNGFMRVFISSLWFFYIESENRSMRSLCPKGVPEGLIPVYDEGTGTAHDEEGNAVEVYITQGRTRGRRMF